MGINPGFAAAASEPDPPKRKGLMSSSLAKIGRRQGAKSGVAADTGMTFGEKLFRDLVKPAERADPARAAAEADEDKRIQTFGSLGIRSAGQLRKFGFSDRAVKKAGAPSSATAALEQTPGTHEYVMRQLDRSKSMKLTPEQRELVDSALFIRQRYADDPAWEGMPDYLRGERKQSPTEAAGRRGRISNDDVLDVLKKVRTADGAAALTAERDGFRAKRAAMSDAAKVDYGAAPFTPEALIDAQARGLTVVRGRGGQAVKLADALKQAGELGWPQFAVRPMSEEQQAAELAPDFAGAKRRARDSAYRAGRQFYLAPFQTVGALVDPAGRLNVRTALMKELKRTLGRELSERDMLGVDQDVKGYTEAVGQMFASVVTGGAGAAAQVASVAERLGLAKVAAGGIGKALPAGAKAIASSVAEDVMPQVILDQAVNSYPQIVGTVHTLLDPNATEEEKKAALLQGAFATFLGTHAGREFVGRASAPVVGRLMQEAGSMAGTIKETWLAMDVSRTTGLSRADSFALVRGLREGAGSIPILREEAPGGAAPEAGSVPQETPNSGGTGSAPLQSTTPEPEAPVGISHGTNERIPDFLVEHRRRRDAKYPVEPEAPVSISHEGGDSRTIDAAVAMLPPDHPLLDPFDESPRAQKVQDALRRALGLEADDDFTAAHQRFHEDVHERGQSAEAAVDLAKQRREHFPGETGGRYKKSDYKTFAEGPDEGMYAWRRKKDGRWYPDMRRPHAFTSLEGLDDPAVLQAVMDRVDALDDGSTVFLSPAETRALTIPAKLRGGGKFTLTAGRESVPNGRRMSEIMRKEHPDPMRVMGEDGALPDGILVPTRALRSYLEDLDATIASHSDGDARLKAQQERLGLTDAEFTEARAHYERLADSGAAEGRGPDAESGAGADGAAPGGARISGLDDVRNGFREHFGLSEQQADAVTRILEARAKAHARIYGGSADDYVASRIGEIRSGDAAGLGERHGLSAQGKKGAVEFLADGRAVIHGLERPDVSTAVHELFHVFHNDLDAGDLRLLQREHAQYLDKFAKKQGTIDGAHGDVREFAARQFERYLRDGETAHPELRGVFEKFKAWLSEIYRSVRGSAIEARVGKDVRGVFERLLDETGEYTARGSADRPMVVEGKVVGRSPEETSRLTDAAVEHRDRTAWLEAELEAAPDDAARADIETELAKARSEFGEEARGGSRRGLFDVSFQEGSDVSDPWIHKSERVIQEKVRGPMEAGQLLKTLESGGVKTEELRWTGLDDWLKSRAGMKVTPDEALQFVRDNRVEVRDVTKGSNPDLADALKKSSEIGEEFNQSFDETRALIGSEGSELSQLDRANLLGAITDSGVLRKESIPANIREAAARTARLRERVSGLKDVVDRLSRDHAVKYDQHAVPGGTNYREVLLTTPGKPQPEAQSAREYYEHFVRKGGEPGWPNLTEARQREIIETMPGFARNWTDPSTLYKSAHWDEPNVLAHVRLSDRTIGGKRTLFVEEVQSDWHQAGARHGYSGQGLPEGYELRPITDGEYPGYEVAKGNEIPIVRGSTPEAAMAEAQKWFDKDKVPPGPMSKNWHELAMKRVIRMAAEEGYDQVAWTTGDTQATRYNQALQAGVDRVMVTPREDGTYNVLATKGGGTVIDDRMDAVRLREMLGSKMSGEAVSAIEGGKPDWVATGDQIKIGGHGMRSFYDEKIPNFLRGYAKKWGAAVGQGTLEAPTPTLPHAGTDIPDGGGGVPVHTLDVTPEMRKSVLTEGQLLFQEEEPPKGWGLDTPVAAPKLPSERAAVRKHAVERLGAGFGNVFDQLEKAAEPGTAARLAGEETARQLDQVLMLTDAHVSRIVGGMTRAIKEVYGPLFNMAPGIRKELNEIPRLIQSKQVDKLNPRQKQIYDRWVDLNRALVEEGRKLGIMVDDHVRVDNGRKLIGELVSFYSQSGPGSGGEAEGLVIGVGKGEIYVRKFGTPGQRVETLPLGTPYSRRQLVDPEYFFPRVVKPEVYEAIERGRGKLYDQVMLAVKEDIGAHDGRSVDEIPDWEAKELLDRTQAPRMRPHPTLGNIARLERPRLPFKLPDELYRDSFYEMATGHARSSVQRIVAADTWGHDLSGLAKQLAKVTRDPSEVAELSRQIRAAMGMESTTTKADKAVRKLLSIEGAWQTTSKLTGLGTTIVQLGASSNAMGVFGVRAFAKGALKMAALGGRSVAAERLRGASYWGKQSPWAQKMRAAAAAIEGSTNEIAKIRESGAVSGQLLELMHVDESAAVARQVSNIAMNVSGVKPVDETLRYHAALSGRAAVEDSLRGLKLDQNGAIRRNAKYRLLSEWFHYTDADIARMRTEGMSEADMTLAYHGGAKSQLRSRNADMPKLFEASPFMKALFRFQTFNYQQARFLGYCVKEAGRGNAMPLVRTLAAYTASGFLTVELKEQLNAWLSAKEPKPPSEDLVKRITGNLVRSGMLGLYGRTFEQLPWEDANEELTPSDAAETVLKSAAKLVDPPAMRDVAGVARALDFAEKSGGGFPAMADEYLRQTVVLYNRLAKRGDPDTAAIERMRKKAEKDLQAEGYSDSDIDDYLDTLMPMPPARNATKEYKQDAAERADLGLGLLNSDLARQISGRRPPKYATDKPKAPAVLPKGTIQGRIAADAPKLGEAYDRLVKRKVKR